MSRFHAKRIFEQDMLKIWQKVVFKQNKVKYSFQERVVFLEQISWKKHFLTRHAYNLAKGSIP